MTSKNKRRRQKKAAQASKHALASMTQQDAPAQDAPEATGRLDIAVSGSMRPTLERRARGVWAIPQGGLKAMQPSVDMASDMIGQLHVGKMITDGQEQAARSFQELRAKYLAEIPEIGLFKSCLAGSVPGYDDSDGNPEVIAAYRSLERALGFIHRRELLWVCDLGNEPTNILKLRTALDLVGGC